MNSLIHQTNNLGGVSGLRKRLLRELLLLNFAHEGNAGQMLAQTIMQVLPDPALLTRADFQDFLFQMFAFGDVNACGDDVSGISLGPR